APKDAVTVRPATIASPRSMGRPACSNSRSSSRSAAALAITTSVLNIQPGALITMSRNTGSITSAVARRITSAGLRGGSRVRLAGVDTSHPAEAAAPPLVVGDGPVEMSRAEVGPEGGRHPQLGVGDLPQQEVGDPHLPARANEQVGI